MKNKCFVACILVFVLALGIRLFFINQKQEFHIDEILSKTISIGTVNKTNIFMAFNKNFHKGAEYKNIYFQKSKNSLSTDLKNLRKDNYGDNAHPSLYYSILRIATENTDNSPKNFLKVGCGLNVLFFIFSFFIMRKLLIKLFGDNKLVPIGLACAFLNTGTISMTLFIRPYELQILSIILISYVYILIKDKLLSSQNILTIKDTLLLTGTVAFGFLSGYYVAIYIAMLGIILLFYARKNIKNFIILIICPVIALGLACVFYTGYFSCIYGQRFNSYTNAKNLFNLYFLYLNLVYYFINLSNYLFYILILIVTTIACFNLKKEKISNGKELLVCAFIWSFAIALTAPFTAVRYIAPVFPILSLIFVFIINNLKENKQKIYGGLFLGLFIITAILPLKSESFDTYYLYYDKNQIYIPFGAKLENLFIYKKPKMDKNSPVVVKARLWFKPMYIISNLDNDRNYLITNDKNEDLKIESYPAKHFYIFSDILYTSIIYNTNELSLKKLSSYGNFNCYEATVIK